jgi:acyl-coenzyme A synthetase/AMP-(fatty) acid ligase
MVLMSPTIDSLFLQRKAEIVGMNQDTVLCVFAYPAFTGAGYRWAASPWTVGATTLIEQGSNHYRALSRPGITHAVMVPSVLASVLAAPADSFPRNEAMHLSVGGGAMTRSQVDETKTRITPRLFNWLASTEAGGIALTPLNTPEDHLWHRLAPGRLVEVVDEYDRPAPVGEIGRVRIGTAGGPTGYLHDEAATRAFFKNGYFYPGDLAVIRSDGRMALQGRNTDIINVQGQKISPAPIEIRLAEVFGVSGVCLFSMQEDSGEEAVHVVIETQTPIEAKRLMAMFGQEFFGFPRVHVHQVAVLPRNQMGKLLRQDVRAHVLSGGSPIIRAS